MNFIKSWYVFYTKPRYEKKIAQKLAGHNFKVYLPLNTILSQWSDHKKKVGKLLFSSYVFVCSETIKGYMSAIIPYRFVLSIIFGGRLVRVLDKEANRITIFLNQFSKAELKGFLDIKVGEKKRVASGFSKNYECEIIKIDNKQKIGVRIESLLQCLVA